MSDYIESKGMVCCRWRGDYRGKKGHRRPAKGKKKRILIERALRRDGYYRGASECRRRGQEGTVEEERGIEEGRGRGRGVEGKQEE